MKLLDILGLGVEKILGRSKKARVSPFEAERRAFEKDVRRQLVKLKEKGISLPIMTL